MAEQLVIYLYDTESLAADWVFTGPGGEATSVCESGTVTDLVEKNSNRLAAVNRISCIVHAELMNYTQLDIPAKNRQRALQAIPYAMEDQLAEDIELLHFAIGQAEGTRYPVATVRHHILRQLLEKLSAAGISPDFLYPDILCLPSPGSHWNILQHQQQFSLSLPHGEVITGDIDVLPFFLQSVIKQHADSLPDSVVIYHEEDFQLPECELPIDTELKLQPYKQTPLLSLVAGLSNPELFNILQGQYQVVKQSNQWWKPWQAAAILAGISLVLALLSGGLDLNRLQKENSQIENEIIRIYKASFPGSKKIVNARVQMENKLKQLKKGSGNTDISFTDILIGSAPIIKQVNGVEIQGINYHNRKLEMQLVLDKLSTAETLKNRLNKLSGIKAELLSASSEAKQVNARIRLEAI